MPSFDSLEALWEQADVLQAETQARYPDMNCHAGCADCCKFHGSPITYPVEWLQIQAQLDRDSVLKQAVKERFQALQQYLRSRLKAQEKPTLREALFVAPCPFLAENRCEIYALRPLTCRTYGNTRLKESTPSDSVQDFYTCDMEKERWEEMLPMAQEEPIHLPARESLFQALEKIDPQAPQTLLVYLERYLRHAKT